MRFSKRCLKEKNHSKKHLQKNLSNQNPHSNKASIQTLLPQNHKHQFTECQTATHAKTREGKPQDILFSPFFSSMSTSAQLVSNSPITMFQSCPILRLLPLLDMLKCNSIQPQVPNQDSHGPSCPPQFRW